MVVDVFQGQSHQLTGQERGGEPPTVAVTSTVIRWFELLLSKWTGRSYSFISGRAR